MIAGEIKINIVKMSENTGFRVTVFFNLFFNNQKSRSSVYVNTGLFHTVQAFKEHISYLFNVPHGDFDLHCENNFLPPEEDIRVLKPEDTVLIVPTKWYSKRKHQRPNETLEDVGSLDNFEDNSLLILPKTKLKRKRSSIQPREFKDNPDIVSHADESGKLKNVMPYKSESKKKRKECVEPINTETCTEITTKKVIKIQETTNNSECIESESTNGSSMIQKINFFEHLTHSTESNSEKAKDSMMRCYLPKCNSCNNSENAQSDIIIVKESPLKETPTFVVNRRNRTSTPYVQPIGTLLKELKCASFDIENNAMVEESKSLIKKRKRYRKRKHTTKTDGILEIEETPPLIPYVSHPQTQPNHIKFSDDVEIIPDVVTVTDNGNSTDSAIEVAYNGGNMDVITAHTPTMTLASIESSPSMKNITPKAGDLIAFKVRTMLRLTDTYTPELSKYITAKTIFYDLMSKSISLQIIEGGDQMKVPNGKFSLAVLEGIEEKGQLSEEMTIDWDRLIEPRLLYP